MKNCESTVLAVTFVERRKPCFLVAIQDVEDQMFSPSPTKHRATLWETWGARQGWIKGINAAATVATLSLGFLTLVETAYLFGIGKVCGTTR